jgi:hypothetical protein
MTAHLCLVEMTAHLCLVLSLECLAEKNGKLL